MQSLFFGFLVAVPYETKIDRAEQVYNAGRNSVLCFLYRFLTAPTAPTCAR